MAFVPVPPTVSRTTPPLEVIGSTFLHFLSVRLEGNLRSCLSPMARILTLLISSLCTTQYDIRLSWTYSDVPNLECCLQRHSPYTSLGETITYKV
jgi:hypothetical protein